MILKEVVILIISGGLLLETYTKGGMMAAEKLIREEFVAYTYNGGKGRVINRAEYLRWKFRDQKQVSDNGLLLWSLRR